MRPAKIENFKKTKPLHCFSPTDVAKHGGINGLLKAFREKNPLPTAMPNFDFTEKEWDDMMKQLD